MRRALGFVAVLCTLSLLIITPVSATEFKNSAYFYNLYARGETYGGYLNGVPVSGAIGRNTTGSFEIPLNLNSNFRTLYFGSYYNSISYDYGAEYTYVVTITTGVTGSYTGGVPTLYGSQFGSINGNVDTSVSKIVAQKGTLEKGVSDTYTFTYTDIPYEKVQGFDVFYLNLLLSNFTSSDSNTLYIVNSYFGLESYFIEEKYQGEVTENLNKINENLDNIEQGINDTNDKLDDTNEKLDGIQGSIDNQYENEKDKATADSEDANAQANDSVNLMPDFSDSYTTILDNLTSSLYDNTVSTTFDLPNGEVEIFGRTLDIFAGNDSIDLSSLLSNEYVQIFILISKALSIMSCMATSVYWGFQIKEWITSTEVPAETIPDIPLMPK